MLFSALFLFSLLNTSALLSHADQIDESHDDVIDEYLNSFKVVQLDATDNFTCIISEINPCSMKTMNLTLNLVQPGGRTGCVDPSSPYIFQVKKPIY
jgi:uncharacterized UPF0160 family protein